MPQWHMNVLMFFSRESDTSRPYSFRSASAVPAIKGRVNLGEPDTKRMDAPVMPNMSPKVSGNCWLISPFALCSGCTLSSRRSERRVEFARRLSLCD